MIFYKKYISNNIFPGKTWSEEWWQRDISNIGTTQPMGLNKRSQTSAKALPGKTKLNKTLGEQGKIFTVAVTVNINCHCALCSSERTQRLMTGQSLYWVSLWSQRSEVMGLWGWFHYKLLHNLLLEEREISGKWQLCWKGVFSRAWAQSLFLQVSDSFPPPAQQKDMVINLCQ